MAMAQGSQPSGGVWRLGPAQSTEPPASDHPAPETENPPAEPVTAEYVTAEFQAPSWVHADAVLERQTPNVATPSEDGPDEPDGVSATSLTQRIPLTSQTQQVPDTVLTQEVPNTTHLPWQSDKSPSTAGDIGHDPFPASAPTRKGRLPRRWVLGGIGAVVIAAAAVAIAATHQQPQAKPSPQATVQLAIPATTPVAIETPQEPATPTPTADSEQTALDDLNRLHDQDLTALTFSGQWVAQMASKTVGILDPLQSTRNGTHTFLAADILWEHQQLREGDNSGADVRLLISTDYGQRHTYEGKPLWVTVAMDPAYNSSADVEAWCARRFATLNGDALNNACVPRQLNPPR